MKKDVYELTNPQKSIWVTEQYYKNTAVNNICGYVYISDNADLKVLEKAINELVKNNDGMRLQIDTTSQNPVQFIQRYSYFNIDIIDLPSSKDIENEALRIANIPFTSDDNYLFKFVLFRLSDGSGGFIVNVHHLIGDSWSLGLIAKESTAIYSALLSNAYEEKSFPSYLGYIDAENVYKGSNKWLKDRAYWQEVFSTVPEVASFLPKKSAKSSSDISCVGKRKRFSFSKKDLSKVKNFCDTYKVSIYNFFMAVYSLYLSRINNLDDFVIGTPILNRTSFDLKHTMGMFISVAPLRVSLDSNVAFVDFVKNISSQTMSVFRHQKYSYQSILEDLRQKDSSIPNLYNVIVSYQITKTIEESSDVHYSTDWVFNGNCADELQIHLFDINDENALSIAYDYKSDLFDESEIKKFHKRILCIIDQIIENENILMNDIEIVTAEEKELIFKKFNNNSISIPNDITLTSMFDLVVKQHTSDLAVTYNNSSISYKELDLLSNALALKLLYNGVQPEDIVGVCMNRSIELVISIWAILKIGAVYMPMYTKYPIDRLNYMLENSNCSFVITNSIMNESLAFNVKKIIFNNYSSLLSEPSVLPNVTSKFMQDDLAYVIYTSGSTGKPKGAQLTHKNLINFIYSFNKDFKKIDNNDNFLASTNISFDVSIFELFLSILNGAHLVLYNEDTITDIINYTNIIINNHITTLYIPPNILNNVYAILKEAHYSGITKLLVGVESIKKSSLNNFYVLNKNLIIVNGYGPTETTICATSFNYKKDYSSDDYVSIGGPLCNNNIYILSKFNTLQPVGIIGELCISGFGVGKGYLNNPIETESHFVHNSLDSDSKFMYKTGDLAKWNSDGTLFFLGRKDNQIKLRGYRIELSEINNIVEQNPYISRALTTIREINSQKYIVTYYTTAQPLHRSTLDVYLKARLPFYMIPNYYVELKEFPITVNGKIDSKKLPLPFEETVEYVAPYTKKQTILCSIWSQLFNKDKISITDNFFNLGGDSLTAIKFQIEALKFNININYRDIFHYPTIELLSKKKLTYSMYDYDPNYDYSKINHLISINTSSNITNSKKHTNFSGNILLCGATGFLGAHILSAFLDNSTGVAYCLLRDVGNLDKEERLRKTLNFYFDEKYNSYFGKRIKIIHGDISVDNLGLTDEKYNFLGNKLDCVINSAALVKHYGDYQLFDNINVQGTKNVINFSKKFNLKLYHISTVSVSGIVDPNDDLREERIIFDETKFYIGQNLSNAYIFTKFEAERLILEEILDGLDACILRLGNISNRVSDSKFQINTVDNAYINRIKSLFKLGVLPKTFLDHSIEFTPVDSCADAIIKIVFNNPKFNILHLFNTNLISIPELLLIFKDLGYPLECVSKKDFVKKVDTFLQDSVLKDSISGIIPDLDSNKNLNLISKILPDANFTTRYLDSLGFKWPLINSEYITNYIQYFKNIGYIE